MIKSWRIYGIMMVLIQVLYGCSAQEKPAQQSNEPKAVTAPAHAIGNEKLIVAFGDSLYAGYQLGPKEGLAPQLQAELVANGVNARVYNAGVSGDTSAAGKSRLSFVLDNLERKPQLVLLGLGGNDMLRGIKPEQTRANLDFILTELKRRDISVVMTGMLAAPNMGRDYGDAFAAIFPQLSAKYKTPLYPFMLDGIVTDKSLMLDDNIHPNAKGVARAVSGILPLVEKALAQIE